MQFRLGTYVSVLAVAFLTYAGMVTIVIKKIEVQIITPACVYSAVPPASSPVQEHGLGFFLLSNVCALWLAGHVILRFRRRTNRHRSGFCSGCGHRLTMDILRCPRCGEKRSIFGSLEPLFPVIMAPPQKANRAANHQEQRVSRF